MENICKVGIDILDGVDIGRMERHGDHRLDLAQIDVYKTVIVSDCARIQFPEVITSSVDIVELFDLVIGSPDRREAGCLCRHNIDSDTEVCT